MIDDRFEFTAGDERQPLVSIRELARPALEIRQRPEKRLLRGVLRGWLGNVRGQRRDERRRQQDRDRQE